MKVLHFRDFNCEGIGGDGKSFLEGEDREPVSVAVFEDLSSVPIVCGYYDPETENCVDNRACPHVRDPIEFPLKSDPNYLDRIEAGLAATRISVRSWS
ncbi:hypothetical protein HN935_02350 [archaeon]|jgi:hypothetical protein|nr:hypothetical protein [archaeon]